MAKKFFALFSYIFHPLFVPLYGAFLYFELNQSYFEPKLFLFLLVQIIIITILLPIAFFFLLKILKKVDTIMIENINQRKLPLLIQIILTSILVFRSFNNTNFDELYWFFVAAIISTSIALLFALARIKISLHMLGMGALLAFTIGLSFANQTNNLILLSSLFFICGCVATSRLLLNAHTNKELILGFFVGILPQFWLCQFWL